MDNTKGSSNPMWGNKSLDSPVTKPTSQGVPGVTVPANQTLGLPQANTSTPDTHPDATVQPETPPGQLPQTEESDNAPPPLNPLEANEPNPLTSPPPVQELDPALPTQSHAQTLQNQQQGVPAAPIPQPTDQPGQNQQDPAQQNQIPSQFVYAGFFKRFVAAILDLFIIAVPFIVISFVLIFTGIMKAPAADGSIDATFALINYAIMPLVSFAYYIYFTGAKGQTLGKKILRIKVIKKDSHEVPGYLKAFLREIVGKTLNSFIMGLGYFWMLWDKDKQTWADKIASTIVIKT